MSREALQRFMNYGWPGNIRELEQCLTNAVLVAEKGVIQPGHLLLQEDLYPERAREREVVAAGARISFNPQQALADYEQEIIMKTLDYYSGNKSESARHLAVSRLTLHNKLKSYQQG